MGWNTSVVILNDAIDQIKNDRAFGRNLADAISGCVAFGEPVDVQSGNHTNAAQVVETHHMDETAIVAVGGNCGTNITNIWLHGEGSYEERVLKALAEKLGYVVYKKRS